MIINVGDVGIPLMRCSVLPDMEKPTKKKCPSCGKKKVEIVVGAASIVDSVRIGITKPDKGWQEVMAKVKEAHPRNDMKKKSKQDWMH